MAGKEPPSSKGVIYRVTFTVLKSKLFFIYTNLRYCLFNRKNRKDLRKVTRINFKIYWALLLQRVFVIFVIPRNEGSPQETNTKWILIIELLTEIPRSSE